MSVPSLLTLSQECSRSNTILVVGHSNQYGLQLANGDCGFQEWWVIAKWLESFRPKTLVFVACLAARFDGAKALFEGIKSLHTVYGSPLKLYPQQVAPLIVLAVALMNRWKIPEDLKMSVQVATFLNSRGVLYRWTRREVLVKQNFDGRWWNRFADSLRSIFDG